MNEGWVNDWYLLGATSDVAEGMVCLRTVGHMNLAVFRVEGEYFAARDNCGGCSHSLAGGAVLDHAVVCPQCRQRLSVIAEASGSGIDGEHRLPVYPVMVVNDEFFAWIEELA